MYLSTIMKQNAVYDYTDKLKELLAKTSKVLAISREFKDITDNAERVKFLEKLLLEYNLIGDDKNLKLNKSNAIAESCRAKGNKFYASKHFLDALESYNQSLCFAESGSSNVGLAYANRSAVFFELSLFDNCLHNIQLAKQNNYPAENMQKLDERIEVCLELMNNKEKLEDLSTPVGIEYFKLTRTASEKLPYIADCLEMKSDKNFGRYITTKSSLKPGDVVCSEEPFSKLLLPAQRYKYCANCLNDNFLDLISCDSCTSTMFCSDVCANIGKKKFHDYECPVVDKLNSLCTKILRIAVRTFFEALDVCGGNVEDLKALIKENEGSTATVFDFDEPLKRTNVLRAVDALATNESSRVVPDMFQRSGIVAVVTYLLLKQEKLNKLLSSEEDKDFFRSFVLKQTQLAACNYHGLFNGVAKLCDLESNTQYGSASFPFCSLINHSCAPNLVRVTTGCKNYVLVNRPIPAGGQLFDNYGFHHCLETFAERQTSLLTQYHFSCRCEACNKKYPLYEQVPHHSKNFESFISDDVAKLRSLNVKLAKEKFKSYCNYLMKNDKHYPSYELSSVDQCLLRCYMLFAMSEFKLKLCAN